MRNLAIFGSTGSIGEKVLEVVRLFSDEFSVVALGVRKNVDKLKEQVYEFKPKYVYIHDLSSNIDVGGGVRVLTGYDGIIEVCSCDEVDTVVVAVDGYFGVFPTVEAIKMNKKVLTANKESIFVWGYEILNLAKMYGIDLIPIDSEHNTIFNLLSKVGKDSVFKYIITASGGPFLNKDLEYMEKVDLEEVMNHPNWKMGKIVTFNSATMFNKLLEVFEAHVFFEIDIGDIVVVVHPESRIHSMLLLKDGTIWNVYYRPDMIFPISNALFYPSVPNLIENNVSYELPLDRVLTFRHLDVSRFPLMSLVRDIQSSGKEKRLVLNIANEECISFFERGEIKFGDIPEILIRCFNEFSYDCDLSVSPDLPEKVENLRVEIRNFISNL
ncbi:MAG: 1-deoxy-D-xylulose-5-phosphate reductoisomerase [Brevinematia bacterium]